MILLNDILNLSNLKNVKLRFNLSFGTNRPAIDYYTDYTEASTKHMLEGMYWNYEKKSNFSVGNVTLGFLKMPSKDDCWLLFHVGKVTKDLNVRNGVGYEYEELTEFNKYLGRVVVHFHNNSQNLIRRGETTLQLCELKEILLSSSLYLSAYLFMFQEKLLWVLSVPMCHSVCCRVLLPMLSLRPTPIVRC